MEGIGGTLIIIWFVAILFGGPDTRSIAWSMLLALVGLAILAAILLIALG